MDTNYMLTEKFGINNNKILYKKNEKSVPI